MVYIRISIMRWAWALCKALHCKKNMLYSFHSTSFSYRSYTSPKYLSLSFDEHNLIICVNQALSILSIFIVHLGRVIIGYCLIAPVHLDGDPVPVVAGADLLIRKPDAHYRNYTLTFTLTFRISLGMTLKLFFLTFRTTIRVDNRMTIRIMSGWHSFRVRRFTELTSGCSLHWGTGPGCPGPCLCPAPWSWPPPRCGDWCRPSRYHSRYR